MNRLQSSHRWLQTRIGSLCKKLTKLFKSVSLTYQHWDWLTLILFLTIPYRLLIFHHTIRLLTSAYSVKSSRFLFLCTSKKLGQKRFFTASIDYWEQLGKLSTNFILFNIHISCIINWLLAFDKPYGKFYVITCAMLIFHFTYFILFNSQPYEFSYYCKWNAN